jgi:hypothetical protein
MTTPETMTNQELRELVASLSVSQAKNELAQDKTDAKLNKLAEMSGETDARLNKLAEMSGVTDAKLNKLAEMYGGVSANQGSAAEEFFFNSLSANPVIGGVKYDRVTPHLVVGAKGRQSEFDLVLVNGNSVALIEVKHKAQLSAFDQLERQMKRYRESFPEHASYKLYGGIAGFSVLDETVEEAHKRGLFVLKQVGSVFTVDAEAMRAF